MWWNSRFTDMQLVKSTPWRIKAVPKVKAGPTQYQAYSVLNKWVYVFPFYSTRGWILLVPTEFHIPQGIIYQTLAWPDNHQKIFLAKELTELNDNRKTLKVPHNALKIKRHRMNSHNSGHANRLSTLISPSEDQGDCRFNLIAICSSYQLTR